MNSRPSIYKFATTSTPIESSGNATASTSAIKQQPYTPPAPPPVVIGIGLKKDPVAERHMRQVIRDLVTSIDPYAQLDPDAEDALLDVASEFIESTTSFGARLARHRSSDSLDVKDLQLHLERQHGIRIPGFTSAEDLGKLTANSAQQTSGTSGAVTNAATGAKGKDKDKDKTGVSASAAGSLSTAPPTLRSRRLAATKEG